ncbi:cell wall hydrolase [Aestuariivirga sp.]|uniref:cell wall hydrolase n=1 Tax=Aestuariivirga sp. TaxID=2650926 RepID=UPI0025C1F4FB|nr:cell wall hydrolase [Aestuariivirga sp.]MCA3554601.1 cell wall hydrolase [Aestuariivirga sp.]
MLADHGPMVVAGVMLVLAFAFAGHYMGQNAVAHNADPGDTIENLFGPSSNILAKSSLAPEQVGLPAAGSSAFTSQSVYQEQTVASGGKGDKPVVLQATIVEKQQVRIVPASVNMSEDDTQTPSVIVKGPSPHKVLQGIQLKRTVAAARKPAGQAAQKAIAMRRFQAAEENCLARAVYFEARSESQLGQLAVAKVILNRVKDPEYPKSICGVVYQGSGRRNSCQFSFACDGLPDDVRSAAAWANAKRIAQMAMSGDAKVAAIGTATNYHADYVNPKWAKSMKRLIKIGRHVFYEEG